ncbi:MAG: STAS domain-containing protein [Deferribacterales bacterium]
MKIDISKLGTKVIITVSGSLTVDHIVDLHTKLRDIIDTAETVDMEIGQVEEADLTFLQLLCSAHKSFLERNKRFNVTGMKNELLSREGFAGFIRERGCTKDKSGNCALVKEKHNG